MDLLNALAAQLGREKVVAMCEAFLATKSGAGAAAKKKKAAAEPAADSGGEAPPKAKRQLPLKLVQWQAFVRYCKDKFTDRFEGVKGAPAMQTLCKSIREEEGVWEEFESGWVAPMPALEPAPAVAPAPRRSSPGPAPADLGEDTEDEAAPAAKPKRQWSEEAKASAAAKRAAKKAAKKSAGGASSGSDSESVASVGKVKAE